MAENSSAVGSMASAFRLLAFTMAWLKRFGDRTAAQVSIVQKDGKTLAILPAATHGVRVLRMNARVLSPVGLCGSQNEYHDLGPLITVLDDDLVLRVHHRRRGAIDRAARDRPVAFGASKR